MKEDANYAVNIAVSTIETDRDVKSSDYLKDTHPDLARFFDPNYALRPISTTFTATIINGSEYQNPGY